MINYKPTYSKQLLSLIHEQESKCSIDDYELRRQIENMRLELNWISCDTKHLKHFNYKQPKIKIDWKPKISHHARD